MWNGRMKPNEQIYYASLSKKIPVVIIEVGNFNRGKTWRIAVNNVNRDGYFGEGDIDNDRPRKLGLTLQPFNKNRRPEILIACQHIKSLQWPKNLQMESWVNTLVNDLTARSERKIIVRPHPRCPIRLSNKNITIDTPRKLANTYDDFNFDHNYHAVINYNTGPAIHAAINGTPVICDTTGLAYPVSDRLENIENITLADRESWLIDLVHREWTIEEISKGIPLSRILPFLQTNIS